MQFDCGNVVDFSQEKSAENVALVVIKYLKALPEGILSPLENEFRRCQKAAVADQMELIRTLPGKFNTSYWCTIADVSSRVQIADFVLC